MNRIEGLQNDSGAWTTDPTEIQALVVAFFKNLFTEETSSIQSLEHVEPPTPSLSPEQLSALSKPFNSHEVWRVLKSMSPFKAPGPDGFHAIFFQRYWNLVGNDVTTTVLEILNGRLHPGRLNHTFLTLIPKVEHPQYITQFRPIGLSNVTYKLVTKAIVNGSRVFCQISSPLLNQVLFPSAR